jgi:hypothetical protein
LVGRLAHFVEAAEQEFQAIRAEYERRLLDEETAA